MFCTIFTPLLVLSDALCDSLTNNRVEFSHYNE
jgi:hypothetical protein